MPGAPYDDNRGPRHRRRATGELALVAVVVAMGVVALRFDLGEGGSAATAFSYGLLALAGPTLLLRHRYPLAVLGVLAMAGALMAWEAGNDAALLPTIAVALYAAARTGERGRRLAVAVTVAVLLALAVALLGEDGFAAEFSGELALLLLPVAVGDAARSRAERVAARIEAAAEARVQAERVRIARDLHDVVAHGLSTIAVQSGVAAHLLDRDPDHAREALDIINRTGRASLEELRAMVGVLRSSDDAPLRPIPADPDDLADLLAGAADAGVPVTTTVEGSFPADVGERCVVAVHRIIQEGLTNVARHAGAAPTELVVRHGVDEVVITIENGGGQATTADLASTGVGLVGMGERAESLGGSLTAAPTADGGFVVSATVPYRPRHAGGRTP